MRSPRLFLFLLVASAAFILGPRESSAQETTVLDSLVAADTTDVGPIPIASIATQAVEASAELRSMREHAQPDGLLDGVRTDWESKKGDLAELIAEANRIVADGADANWS
ncbi:hypothetical protein ACFLRO_02400, partial [Bacteroidota bacterium]